MFALNKFSSKSEVKVFPRLDDPYWKPLIMEWFCFFLLPPSLVIYTKFNKNILYLFICLYI